MWFSSEKGKMATPPPAEIVDCHHLAVPLPAEIVDCHHHFIDPENNDFQGFLKSLGAPTYLPEAYEAEIAGLPVTLTVHVEALPDDGHAEARWVAGLMAVGRAPRVAAIVAQIDPAAPDAESQLDALKAISPAVRGTRYIIDYDGEWDNGESNATHVASSRHGKDYLRDPAHAADFERGIAHLASRGLSFDLQVRTNRADLGEKDSVPSFIAQPYVHPVSSSSAVQRSSRRRRRYFRATRSWPCASTTWASHAIWRRTGVRPTRRSWLSGARGCG